MAKYILSKRTQIDIDEIFLYGVENFGENSALSYLIDMRDYFKSLSENPKIGKNRDEIKKGLHSFPYGSHIIFYRVFSKHIRIVRVLHSRKDIPRQFK